MPRKTFQFRMEASLRRRITLRDELKGSVGTLGNRLQQEQNVLARMHEDLRALNDRVNGNLAEQSSLISSGLASLFGAFRSELERLLDEHGRQREAIQRQVEEVRRLEANLAALRRELDRAHQRVKSLETLKAKQADAFRREQRVREQKTIDENSILRSGRPRQD